MNSDNGQTLNGSSRKRAREDETESEKIKRDKAAERQRRKRERDRNGEDAGSADGMYQPSPAAGGTKKRNTSRSDSSNVELSPEEEMKREKVRKAARERQRKHREELKRKKDRQLGEDMGNMPPELQYRVNAEGQYEMQPPDLAHIHQQLPEPPFPTGQLMGGQTFASTLLLSFSCAPLLKSHLLSSLQMTSEELASLEPIIADAWNNWDHGRRVHYAEQVAAAAAAAAGGGPMSGPSSYTVTDPNGIPRYPPGARLVSDPIDPQLNGNGTVDGA